VQRGPTDPVEKGASEGAAFRASAHASRRGPTLIVIAAVAVLGVAILARQAAPPAPTATVVPQRSSAAVVTSVAPSVLPTAEPTSVPPPLDPNATPHPRSVTVRAAAGTTELVPAGPTPVRVSLTLPAGWQQMSPGMYIKKSAPTAVGPVSSPPDPGLSISAWRIRDVYLYPCRWASQVYAEQPSDGRATGLADALAGFWGQDPNQAPFYSNSRIAPLASKPRPATLAGKDATYVEVLIPSDLDFSQCDAGQVLLWNTADGSVRTALGPTEHDRLWVVDVDRGPIVIDASSALTPSAEDQAELQAVIDSIAFKP